jgi:SPP1 gp7 family putative phage head morphogenesis protein
MATVSIKDPTFQAGRIVKAYGEFKRRLTRIKKEVTSVYESLKPIETASNTRSYFLNAEKTYLYEIDLNEILRLNETIDALIEKIMMDDNNQPGDNWFFTGYTEAAYQQGTGYAHAFISQQADSYARTYQNLQQVLFSQPYQRRIGIVSARTFNEMRGFTDDVTKRARFILGETIARGKSPKWAVSQLSEAIDGDKKRALRIARTEMGVAFRSAVMDESAQAARQFELKMKMLWVSALMATTRKSHAERHGQLYTIKEVQDFYSVRGNSVNCRCSQVSTVVNEKGEALAKNLIAKMQKQEEAWIAAGGGVK